MAFLLSAKREHDIIAWRGSSEFMALFREKLMEQLGNVSAPQALRKLEQILSEFEKIKHTDSTVSKNLFLLRESLSLITEPQQLREITTKFYSGIYAHVRIFNSPTAFYQQSSYFLNVIAETILDLSRKRLGLLERHLPEHALIALGPAGRMEFSPFCPLQIMLVCCHANALEMESIRHYGALVHEGFEACGLQVDKEISPKNEEWCCSLTAWSKKLEDGLENPEQDELIDLLRLGDQALLAGSATLSNDFCQMAQKKLSESHIALENLVSRVTSLSNGLGLLGGLRLEKSGPHRGCFLLLEHALQPLTGSVSAFALICRLTTQTSPERVKEMLARRELNVDMTEQLLVTWNKVNELRLIHEQESQPDWTDVAPLHIDPDNLSFNDQESLRETLEAIGHFQRYLYTTYTALGR